MNQWNKYSDSNSSINQRNFVINCFELFEIFMGEIIEKKCNTEHLSLQVNRAVSNHRNVKQSLLYHVIIYES